MLFGFEHSVSLCDLGKKGVEVRASFLRSRDGPVVFYSSVSIPACTLIASPSSYPPPPYVYPRM
ncbi:hypothetical protein CVT26_007991 [Gymnopilus dilepis]|uniref:Uncharacterized protein n=1 Tax=Gymnopilus dilepis TaxID=231916 RepID=A0A409WEL6_9AGAR|nr:hypothetical protein CVT26_007991 [Gymnopilus dilepis]